MKPRHAAQALLWSSKCKGLIKVVQVSVDLFLLVQSFVDVATLGTLSRITAGQMYLYHPFSAAIHGDEFFNDLRWNIVRPQVWLPPAN